MIFEYEKAVLEWFYRAYPKLTQMLYADDILDITSKEPVVRYPVMIYTRNSSDWVLPKPMTVTEADSSGRLQVTTMYHTPQTYTARIYMEKASELLHCANVLRQHWGKESYLYLRLDSNVDDQPFKIAMRLYSMRLVSDRDNLETKGPQRLLEITWRSDLLLCATDFEPGYVGYRISVTPNGDQCQNHIFAEGILPGGGGVEEPGGAGD